MQFKKRRIAVFLAAAMAFGSVSASAEWYFAGYDTRDLNNIGKIYNEKVNGYFTSKSKIDPVSPESVEWRFEGYEYNYPHAGYDRLYLEGTYQKITRYNNQFPQWETRFKDYMWEVCVDPATGGHRIYQRQQTNIPGKGWSWDFGENESVEAVLLSPTNRNAQVSYSFQAFGVANFDLNGRFVSPEVAAMYETFGVNNKIFDYDYNTREIAEGTFFHNANLSALDVNGQYVVSDEEIASQVGAIQSKFVTGPSFHNDNPTKDVAALYLANSDKGWNWDWDVVRYGGAKVAWTPLSYEMEEPYRQYQYLVVNGLVLDGRNDTPRVYRYTNGKATPNVEWRYVNWMDLGTDLANYPMASNPFNIIEWKYIDGKPAYNADGSPVLRIPTGEYANSYIKVTDTAIELWRRTGRGPDEFIYSISRVNHSLGDFDAFAPGAVYTFTE